MKKKSILVIYSGWLGDLVWIVPTLHALKTAFENVSLVVSRIQAPLAAILGNGLVDEIFVDNSSNRLATARQVRRTMRARGVDTFIDLKGRWKTGIYMPWGRGLNLWIPHRRDAREYLLSRLVHPYAAALPQRPDGHMVEAYRSVLPSLGIAPPPVTFAVPFDERTIAEGERRAAQAGLREQTSVALSIGSAQFCKIWPAEYFLQLARILQNDMGCRVVIMGARSFPQNQDYDRQMAHEVFGDGSLTCWIEETDFAVDAYLLQSGAFTLQVGSDSFAGHMAGSAEEVVERTPGAARADNGRWYRAHHTLSLFGPTNPLYCRPYDPTGRFNTVVMPERYPDDCIYDRRAHTCPHYGDRHCQGASHCMRSITVEQVAAAVEKKLREIRQAPGQPGGVPA